MDDSAQNVYVAMVEAELLPNNTYELCAYYGGLSPVKRGSGAWSSVPDWVKVNHWITCRPSAAEYEQSTTPEIQLILNNFVEGKMRTGGQYVSMQKVEYPSPDDHR